MSKSPALTHVPRVGEPVKKWSEREISEADSTYVVAKALNLEPDSMTPVYEALEKRAARFRKFAPTFSQWIEAYEADK